MRPGSQPLPEPSLTPEEGWHCTHIYYEFDRAELSEFDPEDIAAGSNSIQRILDPEGEDAPERFQCSVVSGHKADFGLMMLDPCPLKIDKVHQRLMNSPLGAAITPTYSFVSVTEVSEYVPSVEQYGARLVRDGEDPESESYQAKIRAYQQREPMMRKQRLTPDLPPWQSMCFYPMNKKRKVGENWFTLPFSKRNSLMAEHAQSGMAFAGKVSQLITVGVGLEDWEWGVTLWARNPAYLKDIVYQMRFDEASARYAEFGPFYTSYVCTADELLKHCFTGAVHE